MVNTCISVQHYVVHLVLLAQVAEDAVHRVVLDGLHCMVMKVVGQEDLDHGAKLNDVETSGATVVLFGQFAAVEAEDDLSDFVYLTHCVLLGVERAAYLCR